MGSRMELGPFDTTLPAFTFLFNLYLVWEASTDPALSHVKPKNRTAPE